MAPFVAAAQRAADELLAEEVRSLWVADSRGPRAIRREWMTNGLQGKGKAGAPPSRAASSKQGAAGKRPTATSPEEQRRQQPNGSMPRQMSFHMLDKEMALPAASSSVSPPPAPGDAGSSEDGGDWVQVSRKQPAKGPGSPSRLGVVLPAPARPRSAAGNDSVASPLARQASRNLLASQQSAAAAGGTLDIERGPSPRLPGALRRTEEPCQGRLPTRTLLLVPVAGMKRVDSGTLRGVLEDPRARDITSLVAAKDALEEAEASLSALLPIAADLDLHPLHVCGAQLGALSMSQLEALEQVLHAMLGRVSDAKVHRAVVVEREKAEAEMELREEIRNVRLD